MCRSPHGNICIYIRSDTQPYSLIDRQQLRLPNKRGKEGGNIILFQPQQDGESYLIQAQNPLPLETGLPLILMVVMGIYLCRKQGRKLLTVGDI